MAIGAAGSAIQSRLIAECPVCLECRVTQTFELGTHRMFIAEVLGTHVPERYLDGGGRPDLERMNVLCFADDEYWAFGRRIESLYYTRKQH